MSMQITSAQWLMLDNLTHNWPYHSNLSRGLADEAYLWGVRNEYIKDGSITNLGRGVLLIATVAKELS